jgi:hypothetical protein
MEFVFFEKDCRGMMTNSSFSDAACIPQLLHIFYKILLGFSTLVVFLLIQKSGIGISAIEFTNSNDVRIFI